MKNRKINKIQNKEGTWVKEVNILMLLQWSRESICSNKRLN